MTTTAFWKASFERMVRTFAQVLVGSLGLDSVGIVNADWGDGLSLGAGAAVLALLTAIAFSGAGQTGPGVTETAVDRSPLTGA